MLALSSNPSYIGVNLNDSHEWNIAAKWWADWISSGRDIYRAEILGPELLKASGDFNGLQVLDVGCGEGWFSRILASNGANVTAFDIANDLVEIAKEKESASPQGIEYLTLDAEDIKQNWAVEEFDLVTASMALECVPNIELALEGVAAVLKPGGRLALTAAHPDSENIRHAADEPNSTSREWIPSGLNQRRGDPSAPPIMVWRMAILDWKQLIIDSGMIVESVQEPLLDESLADGKPALELATTNPPFMVITARK